MTSAQATEWVFSYGTLQDPAVQRANFGRELVGHPDTLTGYSLSLFAIQDDSVTATSGQVHHKIIQPGLSVTEEVEGMVFHLTVDELAAADRYEVAQYKRVAVTMKSGLTAWAYVRA